MLTVRDQADIRKLSREGVELARGWCRWEREGSPVLLVGDLGEGSVE